MASRSQKGLVTQLQSIISATEKAATDLLKTHGWSVERAANAYFEGGGAAGRGVAAARAPAVSTANIDAEFKRFESAAEPGHVDVDGLERLGAELGVDVYSDIVILLIAFHMRARTMGDFTRDEWIRGFTAMGVESVAALRAKIPELRASLRSDDVWRAFWTWAYDFNCEDGQKSVRLEAVVPLTQMLLPAERWPLAPAWVEFLSQLKKGTVSKDTWNAIPRFIQEVKPDLSNHSEDCEAMRLPPQCTLWCHIPHSFLAPVFADGWPSLLDEFVDYMRKKAKAKPSAAAAASV